LTDVNQKTLKINKDFVMLVLQRKKNQSIHLSFDDIEITVRLLDAYSGYARIGIDAPEQVVIVRDDIKKGKKEK
jgi:carbon storage regulator CsrA